MLAQKYKIWRLKLPKWTKYLSNTDRIAFSGVSGSMKEDFSPKADLEKKVRQTRDQDAAHAQKRVTVPLSMTAHQNTSRIKSVVT